MHRDSFEAVLALNRTAEQLKAALQMTLEEMSQEHAFHYSNGRVSRLSDGAVGEEKYLRGTFQEMLEDKQGSDLQVRLKSLVAYLQEQYEDMKAHVPYDIEGNLVRQAQARKDLDEIQ